MPTAYDLTKTALDDDDDDMSLSLYHESNCEWSNGRKGLRCIWIKIRILHAQRLQDVSASSVQGKSTALQLHGAIYNGFTVMRFYSS
jgi:hypothetical protein